jgi:hypothetical protein
MTRTTFDIMVESMLGGFGKPGRRPLRSGADGLLAKDQASQQRAYDEVADVAADRSRPAMSTGSPSAARSFPKPCASTRPRQTSDAAERADGAWRCADRSSHRIHIPIFALHRNTQ